MNLLCDIRDFKKYNISFLETKKNMIIDGYFTKIIYTDSTISLNGLYLLCPIDLGLGGSATMVAAEGGGIHKPRSIMLQISPDEKVVQMLTQIEYEIIEYYKDYLKLNKVNLYSLKNQLKMGMIKVSGVGGGAAEGGDVKMGIRNTQGLTIKISGIWETETNLGITFKFYL